MGHTSLGIDPQVVEALAKEIKKLADIGVAIGIVVGGGNIFRGMAASARGMDRSQADYMGMLATVMNGLALQDAFSREGLDARVMSAIRMDEVCEPYIRGRALTHLSKGRIVIMVAGTGNPYFTTDSAAALRALELNMDCLMKATNVCGVYDKDPNVHSDAKRYDDITYKQVLVDDLKVMDASSIALCQDNNMDMLVFNIHEPNVFLDAAMGKAVGTHIS